MHGEQVLVVIIGDMVVFTHLCEGNDVGDGALVTAHCSDLWKIIFMIGESHSSARMNSDGFSCDTDIGHQISVA